jgi:hypothetical protein
MHISSICRKASQQLNILKRLGRYLDRLSKLTIFHTFILSNFNFCPLAWHFCTDKNSKKLEKVQERALRFVYDDYTSSYINLLEKALVPSLQIRRNRKLNMLSACRTTTYWAIPGLNQTFIVVETVFSSEMVRKVVLQWFMKIYIFVFFL